jgi:hypothetical protein
MRASSSVSSAEETVGVVEQEESNRAACLRIQRRLAECVGQKLCGTGLAGAPLPTHFVDRSRPRIALIASAAPGVGP